MKYFLLLPLLTVLLLTGCAEKSPHGIPNFATVDAGLYRGGEPTAQGWKYLQSLGVRNAFRLDYKKENTAGVAVPDGVLDIEGQIPPSDIGDFLTAPSQNDLILRATWIAGAMNLKKVDPLLSHFSAMTDPQIGAYLGASMTVTNGAVFVHCLHGQDRTGIVIAYYRVLFCHWTKADAEKEMLAHGFHKELHGLWECWENLK